MPGRTDRGASSTEYGLLISGIAAVLVAAILLVGGMTLGLFDDTCRTISATASSTC